MCMSDFCMPAVSQESPKRPSDHVTSYFQSTESNLRINLKLYRGLQNIFISRTYKILSYCYI